MLNTLLLKTAHKKLKKIIKIYLLLFKRFFFLLLTLELKSREGNVKNAK